MNKALLASVALNVFLAAFVLGRMSVLPQGGSTPTPAGMQTALRNGPPPPPMFGPQELFGDDEMKDRFKEVQAHFEKVQMLRQEFAQDLMKGKVTEEQAAQHLAAIDAEMDGVKKSVQGKAAKKIAEMPDDKRLAFAKRLMENCCFPARGWSSVDIRVFLRNGAAGFGGPPPDDRRGPPPEFHGPPPGQDRGPPPQDGQIPGDFDMGTPPPPPRE